MGPSDRFALAELTNEQRALLGELPTTRFIVPGILACHATPARDDLYLIEDVENGGLVRGTAGMISKRLGAIEARVVLCGHSHRADLVRLANGSMVLNPGSVGSPAYDDTGPPAHVSESGTPYARYALVDESPKSGMTVEFIAIAYAFEEAARRAERNGRHEWAHALRTGFMPR